MTCWNQVRKIKPNNDEKITPNFLVFFPFQPVLPAHSVLPSLFEVDIYSAFQSILPHIQMLWELVLTGEVSWNTDFPLWLSPFAWFFILYFSLSGKSFKAYQSYFLITIVTESLQQGWPVGQCSGLWFNPRLWNLDGLWLQGWTARISLSSQVSS